MARPWQVGVALLALTGCTTIIRADPPLPPGSVIDLTAHDIEHAEPEAELSLAAYGKVPPEYLPPPGKCRIWHPELQPRYQPAIGDCGDVLRYRVPAGALLVRG